MSPASTTTYTVTATNAAGSVTATATVTTTTSSDTTPPTVTAIDAEGWCQGVSLSATVRATFSEPMNAATITTSTIVLRNAANGVVPATVQLRCGAPGRGVDALVATVRVDEYTATITGVEDVAGNALASPYVSSFTTTAAPAATMPTVTLSASPASITSGAASTLTWSSTNATSVSINQGIGTVAASGTRSVSPASTTDLHGDGHQRGRFGHGDRHGDGERAASAADGHVERVARVDRAGAASTLTWSSTNATTITINQGIGTVAASGTRSVSPASTTIYTITATNASGAVTRTATVTVTTSTATPRSLFSASSAPSAFATADSAAIELGVKFRADVDGAVTGVRFYKGATNTGTHVGTLWSMTGVMLAQVTFAGETASGWQQATFSTPVSITAGTFYVVSYHTNVGQYGYTADTFLTAWVDNAPLHAPRSGSSGGTGGNGVYQYGGVAFPTLTSNAANYWVDVLFVPQ